MQETLTKLKPKQEARLLNKTVANGMAQLVPPTLHAREELKPPRVVYLP
ncbi:MAG: hypothetical protein L0Z50_15310 [Verrucomicrobiales bacterium]|nr:hypothetical protein [Verrucomicrobiales bacterium]